MRPGIGASSGQLKLWSPPRLKPLAADLNSVAGSRFAPGDGNSGSGKSLVPPGS